MSAGRAELIKCPQCDAIQAAMVEHTIPFATYVHTCVACGYTIMESEWAPVDLITTVAWRHERDITAAHHEACSCGGGGPGESCSACEMWHQLFPYAGSA